MTPMEHDATQLLIAWDNGDEEALAQLAPLVEKELHRLARFYLSRERPNHTLQALSRATTRLCAQLGQSLSAIQPPERPLEQTTTSDLRAVKAYSECNDLAARGRFVEALPFARRAAELDPQFAGGYNFLAIISLVERPGSFPPPYFQPKPLSSLAFGLEAKRWGTSGALH